LKGNNGIPKSKGLGLGLGLGSGLGLGLGLGFQKAGENHKKIATNSSGKYGYISVLEETGSLWE